MKLYGILSDRTQWMRLKYVDKGIEIDLPWPPGAPLFVAYRFTWLAECGWKLDQALEAAEAAKAGGG